MIRTKTIQLILVSLFFIISISESSRAQEIIFEQSNESGIYKNGEKVEISVFLKNIKTDSLLVSVLENNREELSNQKIQYFGKKLVIFDEKFDKSTSIIVKVQVEDEFNSIGFVVNPEGFMPGTDRPEDFDSYWKNEIKALRNLPMKEKELAVKDVEKGYFCSNVEINCTGPKPARGYFAKPKGAKPKSLPIVLFVHAAGVKGSWCLSQKKNAIDYAKMGNGALAFDLNAHGMLNGQPQSYYDELEEGELKKYFNIGVENRNAFYFRGMYLRLLRTLDFLTKQPEWDGKRILVIGESQGGGQALAAAGLDPRVTAVVATVPAMCDWGGWLVGRRGGWPNYFGASFDKDNMHKTIPYFDAAHLLVNSKTTIVTEIGFIDGTCPAASVYAAINQAKGKKIIFGVPNREHLLSKIKDRDHWEKTVNEPKIEFIEEFLK